MSTSAPPMTPVLLASDAPAHWAYDRWVAGLPGHLLAVSARFDVAWQRAAVGAAEAAGLPLLPVRVTEREALLGPVRPAGGTGKPPAAGCAGCAETRAPAGGADRTADPALGWLTGAYLAARRDAPFQPGELVSIRADGTVTSHRVRRDSRCRLCGRPQLDLPRQRLAAPRPRTLTPRPTANDIPVREGAPFDLDPQRMRRELLDPRYGPVTRIRRRGRMPFALTEAELLGGEHSGYGRSRSFRNADAVAVLEAFERIASTLRDCPVVSSMTAAALGDIAIDPATMGHHTERQLMAPDCQIRAYSADVELDWVWTHRLRDGRPFLVPAELGYYRYAYAPGPDGERRLGCFRESSSGDALGASYEEATLHSLIELAERDAFLLAWHRTQPLPSIDLATVGDAQCLMLADTIAGAGYDVHLLAATSDLHIPVVWTLAVHRDLVFPATFSAAGAAVDPVDAVRAGLFELGQLVQSRDGIGESVAHRMNADHWQIRQITDHIAVSTLPEAAPRVLQCTGGPVVSLQEAFDGWPQGLVEHANGDVTGALDFVAGLFTDAGLRDVYVVDKSSEEHRDLGLCAVKAVVPGIVPMCFGHPYQRLAGIRRLADAMSAAGRPVDEALVPFDPHPFP